MLNPAINEDGRLNPGTRATARSGPPLPGFPFSPTFGTRNPLVWTHTQRTDDVEFDECFQPPCAFADVARLSGYSGVVVVSCNQRLRLNNEIKEKATHRKYECTVLRGRAVSEFQTTPSYR